MKVEVRVTKSFKRQAKPLLKKYASLQSELSTLEKELLIKPSMGISIGSNAFKIRLSVKSKGKGKSGGLRVISYLETELLIFLNAQESVTIVHLISIYDKSETENISSKELKDLINKANES